MNVALFWDKVDFLEYVPLVPTSAITGDGMGDLIALLVEYSLKNLVELLMLSMELEAMVMEVSMEEEIVHILYNFFLAGQSFSWSGNYN